MGRAANPTKSVVNDARTPTLGELPGKNNFGNTRAATVPYRKKSYHSMVVPTVLAMTARRRWTDSCAAMVDTVASRGPGNAPFDSDVPTVRTAKPSDVRRGTFLYEFVQEGAPPYGVN